MMGGCLSYGLCWNIRGKEKKRDVGFQDFLSKHPGLHPSISPRCHKSSLDIPTLGNEPTKSAEHWVSPGGHGFAIRRWRWQSSAQRWAQTTSLVIRAISADGETGVAPLGTPSSLSGEPDVYPPVFFTMESMKEAYQLWETCHLYLHLLLNPDC